MEHYKKVYLNPDDHRRMDITAFIVGIILKVLVLPILLWFRLYFWTYDGTFSEKIEYRKQMKQERRKKKELYEKYNKEQES